MVPKPCHLYIVGPLDLVPNYNTLQLPFHYVSGLLVTGVTRSHVPTRFDVPVRAYGCPSDTYARPTTTPIY